MRHLFMTVPLVAFVLVGLQDTLPPAGTDTKTPPRTSRTADPDFYGLARAAKAARDKSASLRQAAEDAARKVGEARKELAKLEAESNEANVTAEESAKLADSLEEQARKSIADTIEKVREAEGLIGPMPAKSTPPKKTGSTFPARANSFLASPPPPIKETPKPPVKKPDPPPKLEEDDPRPPERATITVTCPNDAVLTIDGGRTNLTGRERSFSTPPLPYGRVLKYTFQCRWEDDEGQPKLVEKEVVVRAGEKVAVDLRKNRD